MTDFILRMFGFPKPKEEKADDFFEFINSKSGEKVKIMRQVLREASEEQRLMMEKYKERTLA